MSYDLEKGLKLLRGMVASVSAETQKKFELQIWRLQENIRSEAQFGSSESIRSDRARIVDELNKLSLYYLKTSFTNLCIDKFQSDDYRLNTESLSGQPVGGSSTKEEEQTLSSATNKQSKYKINTSQEYSQLSKNDELQMVTKKWYKKAWAIIIAIGIVLAIVLTSIQLYDRFSSDGKNQEEDAMVEP